MGVAVRQLHYAANDVRSRYDAPRFQPRIVRLPARAPQRAAGVSWMVVCAGVLALGGVFLLGALTGAVLWFTYDMHAVTMAVAEPVSVPVTEPSAAIVIVAPPTMKPVTEVSVEMPEIVEPVVPDLSVTAGSLMPPPVDDPLIAAVAEKMAMSVPASVPVPVPREAGRTRIVFHDAVDEEKPGDDPQALADQAQALARRGETERAIRLLDRAVRDAPDEISHRLSLAILYDRAGHRAEALMLYRQVLAAWGAAEDLSGMPASMPAILRRAEYLEELLKKQQ